MNEDTRTEYRSRKTRWANHALSQLSFFNNLLISLSAGFLAFAFKNKLIQPSHISATNIDFHITTYNISAISIALSILIGLLITITRLFDFRISRHINQTRERVYLFTEKELNKKTPHNYNPFNVRSPKNYY